MYSDDYRYIQVRILMN